MTTTPTNPLIAARRNDSDRRRRKVLDALDRLRTGGQEITVSAVARTAGVDRSFLYRHHDLRSQILALADEPEPHPASTGIRPDSRCWRRSASSPKTNLWPPVRPVRFEAPRRPHLLHSRFRHPGSCGHGSAAPMGFAGRTVVQCQIHDLVDLLLRDRLLATPALADLRELDQPLLGEPGAPPADRRRRHRQRRPRSPCSPDRRPPSTTPAPGPPRDAARTATAPQTREPHAALGTPAEPERVASCCESYRIISN